MRLKTEVLIIGAGPGGYPAAIRLGQLGKKSIVVDKAGFEGLGGICMAHGCIPSKALIHASKFFHKIKSAGDMGINISDASVDASKMQDWKNGILNKLRTGIDFLLKNNHSQWIRGEAYFDSSRSVVIKGHPEVEAIDFDYAIIGTGAVPNSLSGVEFDGKDILSYEEALDLREIPKDLLVIGAGYIAVEMAACYARLGSKVKLVYRRDRVLREYDEDVAKVVQKKMQKDGVEFVFNSNVSKVERVSGRLSVTINTQGTESKVETDKILVATGVSPNSKKLGLENIKVKVDDKGFIIVDKKMRTHDPNIFAIGDVATQPMLAHKATMEGKVAAEVIAGHDREFTNEHVPYVVFGDPEIAGVGLTENQAKAKGYEVNIGKFPFTALGRALVEGETQGFVKIIEDKKTGKMLGIVIVGPDASNLIGEAALAIENGMKTEDISKTIHPHPTLTESLQEAAEAVRKMAIHLAEIKLG